MKRSRWAALTASVAFAGCGACATAALAQTPNPAPQNSGASMVKPPPGASGPVNPENMPMVKRPRKPTNDKMMHEPPASSANAK
ncbi:hypothetical protein [Paraburkholderia sp. SIMBA_030]|uniref:hypothetical protein n=1 Tax=Paraburkholderia sp. SIMBA_030 TaxID=3085773 RepID=UPI0039798EEE